MKVNLLAAVAVLLFSATLVAKDQPPKVRVYVAPAPDNGGFVDAESKRLVDSRADFLKAFAKNKTVTVVPSADGADVVLELLSSAGETTGSTTTRTTAVPLIGGLSSSTSADAVRVVRMKLTAGDYTTELVGSRGWTWKDTAFSLAVNVSKWIKNNRTRLAP